MQIEDLDKNYVDDDELKIELEDGEDDFLDFEEFDSEDDSDFDDLECDPY